MIEADVSPPNPEAEVRMLSDALDRALGLPEPPTAICLGNDRMAVRAYGMLHSGGLELPRGISVAGYDDCRAISESRFPRVTTAELPYLRTGERAAAVLLSGIQQGTQELPSCEEVTGKIGWRESVRSRSHD